MTPCAMYQFPSKPTLCMWDKTLWWNAYVFHARFWVQILQTRVDMQMLAGWSCTIAT